MADNIVRFIVFPIFTAIDSIIYSLIETVYNLMIDIATLNFFTNSMYEQFSTRIYTLIGLFMLFKLSFSLIKFIINPDEFNDKSKGGRKIVANVLIVLFLIIATPMIFSGARTLQIKLLENHVVENLILGMGGEVSSEEVDDVGKKTAFLVFGAFYRPSPASCNNIAAQFGQAEDSGMINDESNTCLQDFGADNYAVYKDAYKNSSVEDLLGSTVYGESLHSRKLENGKFAINYHFLLSTICGVVVAWVFFLFCFDFAVRSVKFAFLQLIAPVPIVSYIDPNSSKNGMFSRWVKESIYTYADLFIRLAAVYFAIYLIMAIRSNASLQGLGAFAVVIVVIGILLFARQVPKLIKDLFGIKSDVKFSFSLSDRLRQTPIVGKAGVMAAGALGGAQAGYKAGKEVGQRGILSGFLGAMTGANQMRDKVSMMGAQAGSKPVHAYGNSMNSVFKQMTNREMTNLNPVNMVAGYTVQNRLKQVKAARNEAMDRLSAAQVTQQAAYNQVQNSAGALNRLDEASRGQFMGAIDAYTRNAKTLTDSKATNDQKAEARRTMNTIRDRVQATYTGDFQDVANHFNDRVAAIEATSVVSSINKDIEDLSKEKSQIERFGHIDSASSRDVNSLLNRYQVPGRQEPDLQEPGRQEPISTVRQSDDGLYQTDSGIITGGSPGAVNRAFQNRNSGNGSNR